MWLREGIGEWRVQSMGSGLMICAWACGTLTSTVEKAGVSFVGEALLDEKKGSPMLMVFFFDASELVSTPKSPPKMKLSSSSCHFR